ncbi:hypothetical protein HanPSC8_Chr00c017g0800751 [Helianthus annuus]|nr:hypothetical protein HanPSC8_Chr00c017g0800751 [Helianthus annuus]
MSIVICWFVTLIRSWICSSVKNQSAAPRPKRGALVHGWIYPMRRLSIWRLREWWGTEEPACPYLQFPMGSRARGRCARLRTIEIGEHVGIDWELLTTLGEVERRVR